MKIHVLLVAMLMPMSAIALSACQPAPPPAPAEQSTEPAIALALRGVTSNDEWTPYIQEFDGVEMALVPAGCFMMGSTEDEVDYTFELCEEVLAECERGWFEGETPQHGICFNEPFWIDAYEVTNGQYGAVSEECTEQSSGDNQPRVCIDWFEAVAHCEGRGARLPTEAEWEYAARGPGGLIFPWGNTFDGSRLNFCDRNCERDWADDTVDDGYEYTAPVGSYRDGVSWVGARDMSGNVWEWVSTIYDQGRFPYPYDAADGREMDGNSDSSSLRVLRGGSWDFKDGGVRAAHRGREYPSLKYGDGGFRCARSY